jgi:hypothetical protein
MVSGRSDGDLAFDIQFSPNPFSKNVFYTRFIFFAAEDTEIGVHRGVVSPQPDGTSNMFVALTKRGILAVSRLPRKMFVQLSSLKAC